MPSSQHLIDRVALPSLALALVVITVAPLRGAEPTKGASAQRPNIVFIFGDDSGIDCYSCYGSDRFKGMSPNIDALAASGIRFDRGYSTPLCGPSRCVLMTGRYGFRTGGMSNQSAHNPSFADLAGARLPETVKFDGRSFAPQLRGEKGNPREWLFVQLGRGWYVRDDGWKLNDRGELFSMKDSPFVEEPVSASATDPNAQAARVRMQAVLNELNPAGGKVEPPQAATKKAQAKKKQAKKQN